MTVEEIDAYLEKEMPKLTRQYGKTTEEKEQSAVDWGACTNRFVLTHNPAAQPKIEERLKEARRPAARSGRLPPRATSCSRSCRSSRASRSCARITRS